MKTVELFFDYTCPYCYRVHLPLMRMLQILSDIQIIWRPVEAHPRVEEPWRSPHSDLAIQGALFLQECVGEELAYHQRIYDACFQERRVIDDLQVLVDCAKDIGLDAKVFEQAVKKGTYAQAQQDANRYAFIENKVWAVPTFISGSKRLDAVEGVGISEQQMEAFLQEIIAEG